MASEKTGYNLFPTYPVTGPVTSKAFPFSGNSSGANISLGGTSFSARVQVSNALNPGPGPDHLFIPPDGSFDDSVTLTAGNPPQTIPGPIRWIRVILDSGTLTGGNVLQQQDTAQNILELVNNASQAAAGTINWTTGDHTTLPLAAPGLYRIVNGAEAGQFWQVAGNTATRRSELEPISPIALTNLLNVLTSAGASQARTIYLEPGTYTVPMLTLPDNITLVGVPGKTILKPPAGAHAPDLDKWITVSAGRTATFRDIILDGNNQYCYGIFVNGSLDYIGGQVINFLGTSGNGAFALTQNSISSSMTVRGTYFTGIHAPPDGAESNAVGASRAVYFTGLNGVVDNCIFDTVGDFEDGDPVHYYRALDANDGWTSAGRGRVTNSTFINAGKRGVKLQCSDVEVSGNRFFNDITDLTLSPRCAVEAFGSRNIITRNLIIYSRAMYGIVCSYPNSHDNQVTNNYVYNGVGTGYTLSRQGNSLSGIFDIAANTLISGNTVECSLYGIYLYTGSTRAQVINNPSVSSATQCIVNDSADATVKNNGLFGPLAGGAAAIGIVFGGNSTNAEVAGNSFTNTTVGLRFLTTSTGHQIGTQTYRSGVTTQINTFGSTGANTLSTPVSYQTTPASTMDAPTFELLMPTGQLNPHFDRDHSDALENAVHRLSNVPVVNLTGVNNSVTAFTALGLTGHNGLQGGVTVNFAAGSPSVYPMSAEVDFGAQSGPLSFSTKFYPAVLFQAVPPGLESVMIEVDTGSGYTTMSTTPVTPARHIRLPGFSAGAAIKKIRYTLNGTTPATGTFLWRRVLLQYPELGATQYKHPSWADFRKSHNSDGSHISSSVTLDIASVPAGQSITHGPVSFGGAVLTDGILANPPANFPTTLMKEVRITATGQLTIILFNPTGAAIDPPSGTWVFKLFH